ncbi:MAG: hypothetical protein U1E70_25155 [Acetobacteraceae bacterium]|nr:hypothetical protein [Pseudomonadota bacterium]
MIVQRALAIAAAICFVAAVAIATFGSGSLSLGQALYLWDHGALDRLLSWTTRILGPWTWTHLMQPLMVRPAWLLPVACGIVFTGLSLSLSNRKSTHRSHRRS